MPQRRSQEEWQDLVADWQASGLSQRAFCEQRQLNYATFRTHVPRPPRLKGGPSEMPLVEVGTGLSENSLIQVLWPDGTQLRFPPTINVVYLSAVLQVLRR